MSIAKLSDIYTVKRWNPFAAVYDIVVGFTGPTSGFLLEGQCDPIKIGEFSETWVSHNSQGWVDIPDYDLAKFNKKVNLYSKRTVPLPEAQ